MRRCFCFAKNREALWQAWTTWRSTHWARPSKVAGVERDVLVAADLDNAVAEWGRFVEGKMDGAARAYWDEVRESNARRSKNGGTTEEVDPDRTDEVREEAWWYWVKQRIRRVVGVAARSDKGGLVRRGKMVIYKPITGDPLVDGENGHENAIEVFVPD